MDLLQEAYRLLRDAEASMRRLIEAAVAQGRYSDVARLAEITEIVGNAVNQMNLTERCEAAPERAATKAPPRPPRKIARVATPPKVRSSNAMKRTIDQSTFPKFEIDGDRMVRIGWSKRDKAIYEHRAIRGLVLETSLHLATASPTAIFRMDDMLPVTLADGTEVPLYQAYLVLAWLRRIGLVEKKGKDGYIWAVDHFDEETFKNAWESTPHRK